MSQWFMLIELSKFKKIDKVSINLESLNIFIGANNSGKSSFIQGIQFAIAACQTLELRNVKWSKAEGGSRTSSLDSSEFLYTPTKDVASLYHGRKLTGAKTRDARSEIEFVFSNGLDSSKVSISKGKNGGFTTTVQGRTLGSLLCDVSNPYCVYVPGIAGIPTQEKYEVAIAVRKSATRGDSNNYLRNIIYSISKDNDKWQAFLCSVKSIYGELSLNVLFDENKSEYIDVTVKLDLIEVPLDAVGTGLLQVIQIFAYIEYFNPKIILLDEPDAHIHPTKQKLLAKELARRSAIDDGLRIVFSTHSRYILEELEGESNVAHFQDGAAFSQVRNGSILVDIGAADVDYLFGRKNLKYVIATEDKVDDIKEKKHFLKKFLLANGLNEDEFVLHSYEGCTKVHFAKILEGFVNKHIPGVKVILHIDRDQKVDTDRDIVGLFADCERHNILCFLTKYQEIESYFCLPEHISLTCGLPLSEAKAIYDKCVDDLKAATIEKLENFILRDRPELVLNSRNMKDIALIKNKAKEWYQHYKYELTSGKELLGMIKSTLQDVFKINPELILKVSAGLKSPDFEILMRN
ncbi:ATP-dependent nuclease [Rheinheimera faecalis]